MDRVVGLEGVRVEYANEVVRGSGRMKVDEEIVELGLKLQGEGTVEGGWVDRVVGLERVRVEHVMRSCAGAAG